MNERTEEHPALTRTPRTSFWAALGVAASVTAVSGGLPGVAAGAERWPAPVLTDANLARWVSFIRPAEEELKWRRVRWHKELSDAAEEARQLGRPVMLWTMNGHPCGET